MPEPRSAEEWAKLIKKTRSCWLWQGRVNGGGYGTRGAKKAHRLVYESLIGPIPNGMTLDHLCRVRRCVNPAHLEIVDLKTNILRGISFSAANASKRTCPRGHAYYVRLNSGKRVRGCYICERERDRQRYAARQRQAGQTYHPRPNGRYSRGSYRAGGDPA